MDVATKPPLPKLNLVIRTEIKTGQTLICWREYASEIGVYFTKDRYHSGVSPAWYYSETKPALWSEGHQRIFNAYTENWEGASVPVLRKKLNPYRDLERVQVTLTRLQ